MTHDRSCSKHRRTSPSCESFDWRRLPPELVQALAAACTPLRGAYAGLAAPERLRRWIGPLPTPAFVGAAWSVLRDVWLAADAAARRDVVQALAAAGSGAHRAAGPDEEWRILESAHDSPALRRAVLERLVKAGRAPAAPQGETLGAPASPSESPST